MAGSVSLRNISGGPLTLGGFAGRTVDADEVIHVDGPLAKKQPDDAIVTGDGDDARAWPTSTWAVVKSSKES